jgi:cysteine desulfurase
VDHRGVLNLDAAIEAIEAGDLVSVMAANSETGAIQPVVELADRLGSKRSSVILHTDAVAASSCVDLRPLVAACDLVTLAGHKLGAPVGIGVLIARGGIDLTSLSFGGAQEAGIRSGTQNVLGALAMSVALEAAMEDQASGRTQSMGRCRDHLAAALTSHRGVELTAREAPRTESHCHVTVAGARSEELLLLLDEEGICAAAGSACSSGAPQASRVLLAMGIDEARARGALRFTLATSTTPEEIESACTAAHSVLERLVG